MRNSYYHFCRGPRPVVGGARSPREESRVFYLVLNSALLERHHSHFATESILLKQALAEIDWKRYKQTESFKRTEFLNKQILRGEKIRGKYVKFL